MVQMSFVVIACSEGFRPTISLARIPESDSLFNMPLCPDMDETAFAFLFWTTFLSESGELISPISRASYEIKISGLYDSLEVVEQKPVNHLYSSPPNS